MILIALGANLPHPRYGAPRETLREALRRLALAGVRLVALSPWYRTAPVPVSDQPWYVNGVAQVETQRTPAELMTLLHGIEADLGRERGELNAARPVDLDIIDFNGRISAPGAWPLLPHPRMAQRAFVLLPLRDVTPLWRHPVAGTSLADLIDALPPDEGIEPCDS